MVNAKAEGQNADEPDGCAVLWSGDRHPVPADAQSSRGINASGNAAMSEITALQAALRALAIELAYSTEDVHAALEFSDRKARRKHPPGIFDAGGRFIADERTFAVNWARRPSKAWPYSEMHAARTAFHCADLHDACEGHVKRIALVYDRLLRWECMEAARRTLMRGIRKRRLPP